MKNDSTVYVGLDVHKESITVAYAIDAGEVESLGKIGTTQRRSIDCASSCSRRLHACVRFTRRVRAATGCIGN